MKIHEYQAKEILRRYGVKTSDGIVTDSADGAAAAYETLGAPLAVVKAQIHAGGRGKGGGVKLVRSAAEARAAAALILSKPLITHQTSPEGQPVKTLLVERGSDIEKEYYVGIAIDRKTQSPVMMASSEGGMDIEEVAAHHPEKILRAAFGANGALADSEAERLARGIGLPAANVADGVAFMKSLSKAFVDLDCALAEINPLILTKDGRVLALDAKINFDSNALYRHPDVVALRDLAEEDPKEIEASKFDLSYIALDGDIGCMVNGAGLAMATMDVIKLAGGSPANFLDVGGGATKEKVKEAFKILLSDPNVKGVLVNIFGGIMKCDVIAEGVIGAVREVALKVPLVVRLEGTNVREGKALLEGSGLPIITASDLNEAARKIVAAVKA
jgi:succinyl-CoA synthetase beta subunit